MPFHKTYHTLFHHFYSGFIYPSLIKKSDSFITSINNIFRVFCQLLLALCCKRCIYNVLISVKGCNYYFIPFNPAFSSPFSKSHLVPLIKLIASARVAGFSLNIPLTTEVTVLIPGFFTPRMDIQRCSASIITITPLGCKISFIASAI